MKILWRLFAAVLFVAVIAWAIHIASQMEHARETSSPPDEPDQDPAQPEDNSPEGLRRRFVSRFDPGPGEFRVDVELRTERSRYRLSDISFPSPLTSPDEINNTVYGEYYEPAEPSDRALIVLPTWKINEGDVEARICSSLVKKGYQVLLLYMPYQKKRSPEGWYSGTLLVIPDLEVTRRNFFQAVQDTRRAATWLLSERGVSPDRLGLVGLGLGGSLGCLAYATDERFGALVTVLSGGELASLLWTGATGKTAWIRDELLTEGVTLQAIREQLAPVEPLTWATPERSDGVLCFACTEEEEMPLENSRLLASAYELPPKRSVIMPGDRLKLLIFLESMMKTTDKHVAECFEQ